jgi:hypothetical protein
MKTPLLLMAVLLSGCSGLSHEAGVPVADIPAAVKAAAEKAVPGLVITEAEVETQNGSTVYELEGTAGGKKCEVKVRADGEVVRVKSEGD